MGLFILISGAGFHEMTLKAAEGDFSETTEISSFETVSGKEICIAEKIPLSEVKSMLPKYLEGITAEGDRVEIPVNWECIGDYDQTGYYYYEFDPVIDFEVFEIAEDAELPYVWLKIENESQKWRSVTTSANESVIYEFLINSLNCNMATAVGILANIERESGFNPKAEANYNGYIYYGICQWGASRYEDLKNYCSAKGYSYDSLKGQLNFLKYELTSTEKSAWNKMQGIEDSAQGAYTAGYNWARYFERCAAVYYEVSAKRAKEVYWPKYLSESESAVYRIFGEDRYETSIRISDRLKEVLEVNKLNSVVLVDGSGYADALSGSYLAYVRNAAILLVNEKNADKMKDYVNKNMKASGTVYILGGENAVSKSIEQKFTDYKVKRLYGKNRYETNLQVLQALDVYSGDLLVCTGTGFADSLSASASGKPILLVGNKLSENQKEYLRKFNVNKIYLIGGINAISKELEKELSAYGTYVRIDGENRYETSVNTAKTFCLNAESAILTYGKNFPDGICGGVLAAKSKSALLLVSDGKEAEAKQYVSGHGILEGFVLGGSKLVTDASVRKVFDLKSIQRINEY